MKSNKKGAYKVSSCKKNRCILNKDIKSAVISRNSILVPVVQLADKRIFC